LVGWTWTGTVRVWALTVGEIVDTVRIDEQPDDEPDVGIRQRGTGDAWREPLLPDRVEGRVIGDPSDGARERERTHPEHFRRRASEIANRNRIHAEHAGRGVRPQPNASQHQTAAHRDSQGAQPRPDDARGGRHAPVGDDRDRDAAVRPDRVQRALAVGDADVEGPEREDVFGEWLGRRSLALEVPSRRSARGHVSSSAG